MKYNKVGSLITVFQLNQAKTPPRPGLLSLLSTFITLWDRKRFAQTYCSKMLFDTQAFSLQKETQLTFGDNFLDSHLITSNGKDPSDEAAATAGTTASSTGSRTRPRAHQLPSRIEEFLHVLNVIQSLVDS